jgi:hypothetical protein
MEAPVATEMTTSSPVVKALTNDGRNKSKATAIAL